MADVGFNFRDTSGYVTDGTDQVFVNGADTYPTGPFNGYTYGWDADLEANDRDRSTTPDVRMAGIHFTSTQNTFRVDVSAAEYDIRVAQGDYSFAATAPHFFLKDDTTTIADHDLADISADNFNDATGVKRTSDSDWVANNAANTHTFTSTIFNFVLGDNSGSHAIAHIFLHPTAAGGAVPHGPLGHPLHGSFAGPIGP